jgi:hypothetical protein
MPSLNSLAFLNYEVSQLDDLGNLSKLQALKLAGFIEVTSVASLSSLTSLTFLHLTQFPALDNVAPLQALRKLQCLELGILSSRSISLEPLRQLPSLDMLTLRGDTDMDLMPDYDLQPLSALSRSLRVLCVTWNVCCATCLPSGRWAGQ